MRRPVRVLCVDDNTDAADSTVMLLRLVGCDAVARYDGPTALAVAAEFRPDVCLLDLHMPVMGGDELATRLRQQAAGRPVLLIALTAMDELLAAGRIQAGGFDMHLVKPADPTRMVDLIRGLTGGGALEDEPPNLGSAAPHAVAPGPGYLLAANTASNGRP